LLDGIGKGLPGEHEETSMKKEEARRAVLSEYDKWAKKHPNDATMMGGFLFFRYLQNERSDLLDFRAVGNKWQIVHGWFSRSVERLA
jgi:hypothetical protein